MFFVVCLYDKYDIPIKENIKTTKNKNTAHIVQQF